MFNHISSEGKQSFTEVFKWFPPKIRPRSLPYDFTHSCQRKYEFIPLLDAGWWSYHVETQILVRLSNVEPG